MASLNACSLMLIHNLELIIYELNLLMPYQQFTIIYSFFLFQVSHLNDLNFLFSITSYIISKFLRFKYLRTFHEAGLSIMS